MIVETDDMVLFWRPEAYLSNWHSPSPFRLIGAHSDHIFYNSEAAFMYLKAIHFFDTASADKIVNNQDPRACKRYGREVKNFNEAEWQKVRCNIMCEANLPKYMQNPKLSKKLLATGNKTIVEASPVDKIWGIGLAPDDLKARDKKNWQGLNLLGDVLMDVRSILRDHVDISPPNAYNARN